MILVKFHFYADAIDIFLKEKVLVYFMLVDNQRRRPKMSPRTALSDVLENKNVLILAVFAGFYAT